MPKQVKRRLGSDFTLGGEQAEADPLLEKGFYESGLYPQSSAAGTVEHSWLDVPGGGKSALLQHLEAERPDHERGRRAAAARRRAVSVRAGQ